MNDKASCPEVEDAGPYRPVGSDLTMNARRMVSTTDVQRQTHALEYIAKTMGIINSKLDRLIEASEKKRNEP